MPCIHLELLSLLYVIIFFLFCSSLSSLQYYIWTLTLPSLFFAFVSSVIVASLYCQLTIPSLYKLATFFSVIVCSLLCNYYIFSETNRSCIGLLVSIEYQLYFHYVYVWLFCRFVTIFINTFMEPCVQVNALIFSKIHVTNVNE